MTTPSLQMAAAAIQRGDFAAAKAICAEALSRTPDDSEALYLLGSALAQSGELEAAIAALEHANTVAPNNVLTLNALGGAYGAARRPDDAIKTLRLALAIEPRFPWARQNLALALKSVGDFASARRNFEQALEVYPDFPDALAGLAEVLLIYGDTDGGQRLADRALQITPTHRAARLVHADCALRTGAPQRALEALDAIEANAQLAAAERARIMTLRARAWERLEDHEAAFSAFTAANGILREIHGAAFEPGDGLLAPRTVAAVTDFLRGADAANWPKPAPTERRTPAFVLGFPRSGTTLLDQILSAHPDVEALEESMNFAEALEPLILAPGALSRWQALTQTDVEALRAAYWRRVETVLGRALQRPLFVDKLPLNTVLLPLIHLLFPDARIVFAVRDPRDVVISCFTQKFEMNVAMYQFLTLETAARYYHAVMQLAGTARERLPLNLHVVRYEDLVGGFDTTVADLLRFLDLPWDDRVRDYATLARERLIRTPSAEQVRKPIYASSIGRWRCYASRMSPLEPVLEKWIHGFGYA